MLRLLKNDHLQQKTRTEFNTPSHSGRPSLQFRNHLPTFILAITNHKTQREIPPKTSLRPARVHLQIAKTSPSQLRHQLTLCPLSFLARRWSCVCVCVCTHMTFHFSLSFKSRRLSYTRMKMFWPWTGQIFL